MEVNMKKEKRTIFKEIRSELTHSQEVSLVHSTPSNEVFEEIRKNLQYLEKCPKNSKKKE
jgi:hypothetical protein